jgi:RNA polymerase sigma-70 factor (ECF subfamily)
VTEIREAATVTRRSGALAPDWDALYRAHAGGILRYCGRLAKSREAAEELMQETFARAIRSGTAPDGAEDVRRWLYRIATNATLDRLRRERLVRFVPFLGREEAPRHDPERSDLVRRSLRAIAPEQATALVLRLHEGFAVDEIAKLLGISEAGVKSRLVRGRRAFIATYERLGGRL